MEASNTLTTDAPKRSIPFQYQLAIDMLRVYFSSGERSYRDKLVAYKTLMTPIDDDRITGSNEIISAWVTFDEPIAYVCHSCSSFPHLRLTPQDDDPDAAELIIKLDYDVGKSEGTTQLGYCSNFRYKAQDAMKELDLTHTYRIKSESHTMIRGEKWLNVIGKKKDVMGKIVFDNIKDIIKSMNQVIIIEITKIPKEGNHAETDGHK
jgi:hypothetical protein